MVAGALALTVPQVSIDAAARVPKGATAKCSDGTYSMAKSKQGACSGHGGVATWLAQEKETPSSKSAAAARKETTETAPAPRTPREAPAPRDTREPSQRSANAPAKAGNPTAQCNDGTYSYAVHHQGACSGHQGVKTWFN
jgi:hypothetical protein